jgi:flagella basal body P-ring formation protein FlgA
MPLRTASCRVRLAQSSGTDFPGHLGICRAIGDNSPMRFILLFLLGLAPGIALAADDPALRAVEHYVLAQLQGQPGKVSVSAGPIDPRLRLPACAAYQPYTPSGTRLIGNVSIGLRCTAPARWSIFVPVKIVIESNYVASAVPLAAGQTLQASDLSVLSGDLGNLPAGVLNDPAQAVGKSLRFAVAAGQPLRQDMLVAPQVIQQGQTVKLIFQGDGFSASNEGKALNAAAEGQVVQARTASGTVVSGIAQANGSVRVGGGAP